MINEEWFISEYSKLLFISYKMFFQSEFFIYIKLWIVLKKKCVKAANILWNLKYFTKQINIEI